MSFPLKLAASGIVCGGVLAVGGHEIYAASTGKPGIFVSKASTSNEGGSIEGRATVQETNEEKIKKLLKEWDGKCVLEIRTANNDQNQELNVIKDNDSSLKKLLDSLEEFSKNNCKNPTSSVRTVIFKETENNEWREITEDIATGANNTLLKYFHAQDEDIIFTVKTKNENNWGELDDNYLSFNGADDDSKIIEISLSIPSSIDDKNPTFVGNGNQHTTFNGISKGFSGISGWKCIITFNKTGTTATKLEDSKTQKLIKSEDKGFFNKLKASTTNNEQEKTRELKKRFIANCGKVNKELLTDGTTLIQSKTFELKEDSAKSKLVFSKPEEFKSWFEEIELTEQEKTLASDESAWNITDEVASDSKGKTLKLSGKNEIEGCYIQLEGEGISDFETKLKGKIGNSDSNKIDNRQKLLRKCRNNNNNLFIYVHNSLENKKVDVKISEIFSS